MAPLILADGMIALEDQLRECFGRVVYSHKAHEKTADILLTRLRRIKLAQIIMSAIVTGGVITVLLGPSDKSQAAALLATVVSTALLALNTYTKDIDLGQAAEKHKETAAQLWSVRESYLSVLADIRAGAASLADVQSRRDELQARLEAIYSAAPRTLDAAYAKAGIVEAKRGADVRRRRNRQVPTSRAEKIVIVAKAESASSAPWSSRQQAVHVPDRRRTR